MCFFIMYISTKITKYYEQFDELHFDIVSLIFRVVYLTGQKWSLSLSEHISSRQIISRSADPDRKTESVRHGLYRS